MTSFVWARKAAKAAAAAAAAAAGECEDAVGAFGPGIDSAGLAGADEDDGSGDEEVRHFI